MRVNEALVKGTTDSKSGSSIDHTAHKPPKKKASKKPIQLKTQDNPLHDANRFPVAKVIGELIKKTEGINFVENYFNFSSFEFWSFLKDLANVYELSHTFL